MRFFLSILSIAFTLVVNIEGHARILRPAGRGSIWRIPQFSSQSPEKNEEDAALGCGSFPQPTDPGVNCGVCGDPFSNPTPRDHEMYGKYGKGIFTGIYKAGQVIDIKMEIVINHGGTVEFRLCPLSEKVPKETQECFNKNVLKLVGDATKVPVYQGVGMLTLEVSVVMPANLKCDRCVLQFNFRGTDAIGECPNSNKTAPGCGPQNTYRGCSDIKIL